MSEYEEELEPNEWKLVMNPVKHRAIDRENSKKWREENPIGDVFVYDMLLDTGIPDDMWLCDLCNDAIPVLDDDNKPLTLEIWCNSKALCTSCADNIKLKYKTDDDTYEVCTCEACVNEVMEDDDEYQMGEGFVYKESDYREEE